MREQKWHEQRASDGRSGRSAFDQKNDLGEQTHFTLLFAMVIVNILLSSVTTLYCTAVRSIFRTSLLKFWARGSFLVNSHEFFLNRYVFPVNQDSIANLAADCQKKCYESAKEKLR